MEQREGANSRKGDGLALGCRWVQPSFDTGHRPLLLWMRAGAGAGAGPRANIATEAKVVAGCVWSEAGLRLWLRPRSGLGPINMQGAEPKKQRCCSSPPPSVSAAAFLRSCLPPLLLMFLTAHFAIYMALSHGNAPFPTRRPPSNCCTPALPKGLPLHRYVWCLHKPTDTNKATKTKKPKHFEGGNMHSRHVVFSHKQPRSEKAASQSEPPHKDSNKKKQAFQTLLSTRT